MGKVPCKVCAEECEEHELVCIKCLEKLQTHYAEVCQKCGHYHFVEWTPPNVMRLCKKTGMDFDILYNTDRAVVIPYRECPQCCTNKICDIVNPKWFN